MPARGVAPAPLCAPGPEEDAYGIDLSAPTGDPLVAQLTALTLYEKSLAEIVGKAPKDATSSVAEAITTLTSVTGDIARIRGSAILSSGQTDQINASADLLTVLEQMQTAHLEATRVRAAVDSFDSAAFLTSLRAAIDRLDRLYDIDTTNRFTAVLSRLEAIEGARSPMTSTDPIVLYSARRDIIAALALAHDDTRSPGARVKPLNDAVDDLEKSDRSLRDALAGRFSPDVAKQISSANRKQAFDLLAKIAALFPAL